MRILLFLICLGAAYGQTVNPGGGGGSSSVGNCQSGSSSPGNCYPSVQTITQSSGTLTGTAASATRDVFNIAQLSANVTVFTINSLTIGEEIDTTCQQAAAAVYTIASPTGFPTIPCSPYPSVYTTSAFIWNGSTATAIAPPATTSLYGSCNEVASPSSPPPSGQQYSWCDSTSHSFRTEDSSGNIYSTVKGVSAPAAGTYVSYIDTSGVQHAGTATNQVYKFGASFGAPSSGTALTTTMVGYSTPAPAACTITHWSITVDSGTATVQFMKVASGTALPTHGSNNINTAGVSIASGTVVDRSTTLTDFTTTSVAAGDIVGVYLTTLSGPDYLAAEFECQ